MFIRMLKDPTFDVEKMQSLRTGIMAGAQCPIDVMEKTLAFAPEMTIAYGMTEVCTTSILVDLLQLIVLVVPKYYCIMLLIE